MSAAIPCPIPDSYWVKPGRFLAGEYPGRQDAETTRRRMDAFLEAGIDTFIDLTHAGELSPYENILMERARARGLTADYARLSIIDHDVPTPDAMKSILDRIDLALEQGRRLYIHCWGGIGRTGTTVGCHLVRHGLSGPQALQQLADWWAEVPKRAYFPRSPETDEQVQFVLNWKETHPRS
jgi:hypothetical protein